MRRSGGGRAPRWAVIGIFVILMLGVFYVGRDFLMPVTLAFLLSLVFSPIPRFLVRRGIPYALSATLVVSLLVLALVVGVYGLGTPVGNLVDKLPSSVATAERKLAGVLLPVRKVLDASDKVDEIGDPPKEPGVQEVVVKQPPRLVDAATSAPGILGAAVLVIALLFFLLASGDLLYVRAVQALPVRVDRKSALGITHAVQTELSRYLFTITVINAALGVAVGLAMWAVGMSNPILWGVIAAVFNFVPFLGALVGVSLSAIVALVTFDSLSGAMLAPGFYLLMTAIEGQFITPSIVGRRLEINSVAVLLSLAFWAWMWGIVGALMAVPILVAVRVLCNHVESLSSFGMFLASRGAQRESGRSEPIAGGEGKSEIAKAGDPG